MNDIRHSSTTIAFYIQNCCSFTEGRAEVLHHIVNTQNQGQA